MLTAVIKILSETKLLRNTTKTSQHINVDPNQRYPHAGTIQDENVQNPPQAFYKITKL